MTTKRPLDRIGGLKKPTAAADEPAVLDLGRVDAAVEPVASRRGFFRGLLNSGVAAGAASTLVGCGGGGGDATRSTTGSLCTRTYRRPIAHADFVTVLAYSPDGTRIASASFDTTVKVWDVASGNLLLIFRGHTRNVEALAFSRSGALLVSAAGASAKVWRVADGAELFDLATPGGNVQAVAVSPDDSSVVTAARVATGGAPDAALVRVWSLASGTLALTTAPRQPGRARRRALQRPGPIHRWKRQRGPLERHHGRCHVHARSHVLAARREPHQHAHGLANWRAHRGLGHHARDCPVGFVRHLRAQLP